MTPFERKQNKCDMYDYRLCMKWPLRRSSSRKTVSQRGRRCLAGAAQHHQLPDLPFLTSLRRVSRCFSSRSCCSGAFYSPEFLCFLLYSSALRLLHKVPMYYFLRNLYSDTSSASAARPIFNAITGLLAFLVLHPPSRQVLSTSCKRPPSSISLTSAIETVFH